MMCVLKKTIYGEAEFFNFASLFCFVRKNMLRLLTYKSKKDIISILMAKIERTTVFIKVDLKLR